MAQTEAIHHPLVCKHFKLGVWHLPRPAFLHRTYIHTSCHSVFRCFVAKLDLLCRFGMRDACHVVLSLSPLSPLSVFLSLALLFLTETQLWHVITGHQRAPVHQHLRLTTWVLLAGNPAYINIFSAPFICSFSGAMKPSGVICTWKICRFYTPACTVAEVKDVS